MSLHASLSTEAATKLRQQRKRSQVLSLVISCLTILLIGGIFSIFILPITMRKDAVIVAYSAPAAEEEAPRQEKVTLQPMDQPSAPPNRMSRVIAAATVSPTAIPVPEINMAEVSPDFGLAVDVGDGWSQGEIGATGSGTIFGRRVTSSNLGVVLDVSGSAHAHLDKAIMEIDKNFPSAHMVLVIGCGMSDGERHIGGGGGKVPGKPRIVGYNDIESEREFNSLGRSVPSQLNDFYRKVGDKRRKELEQYFERRPHLYVLYGADIHGANFAFEFLLEKKVDTIYWFADFADSIDGETIEDLTKQLRRKRVTVIAHNFLGKAVRKRAAAMVEKTGGMTIELIPGEG
jgi:hypothetical protein